jgi:CRP-like cAMP-binding protein
LEQIEYFKLFHNITTDDYNLLTRNLKTKRFKKGEFITVAGQTQRELYFVKTGVQMSYFNTGNKIHVMAFTYQHCPSLIPESFLFQIPSKYFLTCLSDSEMEYISYTSLQKLLDQSQPIERLLRRMTEAAWAGMINRHIELHSMTIEERFISFCQRSPHLLQLVPHKYIASYLGIDPTNFSKLFNTVKI